MHASSRSRVLAVALAVLVSLALGAPMALALPTPHVSAPADAVVQPVAMDTLPTVPQQKRGGGRRRSKEKDKPYQPLAKDPAAESASAHKEYLKRYGF